MLINALVVRDGLTVIARLGDLPVFGQTDVTLEATVAGAVLGMRAVALVLCGALYTAAVDPDQVLALFRRFSFHSALTATLATRMVPVLTRDARRLAEAQRCRPGPPPSRARLVRAATYGRARPRARRGRGPRGAWLRGGSASAWSGRVAAGPGRGMTWPSQPPRLAIAVLAVAGRVAGLEPFSSDPALHAPISAGGLALAVGLLVCALAPFADRRGIER